ncbi:MAG TPA: acyltransferase [Terracidiphilus sp.]|jgi:acetyltransferase-like isoleucine patch superfamily enzyme|nr:acyltransferase [Terracidiphilus sp.]
MIAVTPMSVRSAFKASLRLLALTLVLHRLLQFYILSRFLTPNAALQWVSQALSTKPGVIGQLMRQAFFARTIRGCHPSAIISFGTLLSNTNCSIGQGVYIGPHCMLGSVTVEDHVMLGPHVVVTSGARMHGTADIGLPMSQQKGEHINVRIGTGSWLGAGAIVMADVGADTIIAAGAVVTRAVPDLVVAAGMPAQVVKVRGTSRDN